jgi:hypothetical protein
MRQYVRPFFVPTGPNAANASFSLGKILYDAAGILTTAVILNYVVVPFQLLDLKRSILAWHRMGWYGHIIIAIPLIFFTNGGKKIMRAQLAKRGIVIPGGKGASAGGGNGTSASPTASKHGGSNGVKPAVPPVEPRINGKASKKTKK